MPDGVRPMSSSSPDAVDLRFRGRAVTVRTPRRAAY
jgi:hypothetical protein